MTARGRTWSSPPSSARTSSKHEGGVPQKSSENKNGLEWSTLLVHEKKIQVDSEKKDLEESIIFSKNIINLKLFPNIIMEAFQVDKYKYIAGRTECTSPIKIQIW